ncbi:hypothetical protein WQE_24277 [Paraburkholderia hospita]|uniref:DUF1173 domain-containing protein n=1 Tax=Paraburkholderia hospita TaxID=169430 RepID=A0ABN0FI70_9BURK|nr:DUF1173 family protein [Paraburkholderia hospita]EIM98402.1 hypothetical protein WQE_24277 [Paraburkholderia hospita]OUL87829.1 hypothetical protein CA602_12815 [Paraburkholderia hospita]
MALIAFDGLSVPLEEIQDNPARFATRLERAKKTPGFAVCCCRPSTSEKPLRLVVRRYGALFHLARWPEEGYLHDRSSCTFFADKGPLEESPGRAHDAIRNTPEGLNAKLDISLSVRTVAAVTRSVSNEPTRSNSRRSAPLLGFLQRIWMDSGLNQWSGGQQRNWGTCNAQILALLVEGKMNGKPIQDVLHVMRRYEEAAQATLKAELDGFLSRIQTTKASTERGVVIAEIKAIEPSKYGYVVKIRQTFETFYASTQLIEKAATSFRHAWAMMGKSDARIVAVLVLERTKDRNLRAIDLALQLCNSSFIPCDSGYEFAMANRLVEERRRFDKPMRLVDGDVMLPDFRLTDTAPATAIEVYGMESNDAYLARKATKQTLYAQRGEPCIEWVPPVPLSSVALPSAT